MSAALEGYRTSSILCAQVSHLHTDSCHIALCEVDLHLLGVSAGPRMCLKAFSLLSTPRACLLADLFISRVQGAESVSKTETTDPGSEVGFACFMVFFIQSEY